MSEPTKPSDRERRELRALRAERNDALAANERLARLGRIIERERDEALAELAALRAQAPAPVGGEVVELLRALTPRCTFGITNYNGSGQPCPGDVSPESLCCRARKALAALSPDPTEGGTDE